MCLGWIWSSHLSYLLLLKLLNLLLDGLLVLLALFHWSGVYSISLEDASTSAWFVAADYLCRLILGRIVVLTGVQLLLALSMTEVHSSSMSWFSITPWSCLYLLWRVCTCRNLCSVACTDSKMALTHIGWGSQNLWTWWLTWHLISHGRFAVFVHGEVLLFEILHSRLATFRLHDLLDTTGIWSLGGSLDLGVQSCLTAHLLVHQLTSFPSELRNTVWCHVWWNWVFRLLKAWIMLNLGAINSVWGHLILWRIDCHRVIDTIVNASSTWSSLSIDLCFRSDMQVMCLLCLTRWLLILLGKVAYSIGLGLIYHFVSCLHLFHCLLVTKSSRINGIDTIDIQVLDCSWSSHVLTICFFSTFIRQDVFIHQEVDTSTELVNRVLFVSAYFFLIFLGQPWQDILIIRLSTSTCTWRSSISRLQQWFDKLHFIISVLALYLFEQCFKLLDVGAFNFAFLLRWSIFRNVL